MGKKSDSCSALQNPIEPIFGRGKGLAGGILEKDQITSIRLHQSVVQLNSSLEPVLGADLSGVARFGVDGRIDGDVGVHLKVVVARNHFPGQANAVHELNGVIAVDVGVPIDEIAQRDHEVDRFFLNKFFLPLEKGFGVFKKVPMNPRRDGIIGTDEMQVS
jgi:hypothetical protein